MTADTVKQVVAACFPSTFDAELAKAALGNEGIQAVVEAAESNVTLSHMGSGLRGVKLLVAEPDLASAREVLRQKADTEAPQSIWTCPRCQSTVDAGFATCWFCGQDWVMDSELD